MRACLCRNMVIFVVVKESAKCCRWRITEHRRKASCKSRAEKGFSTRNSLTRVGYSAIHDVFTKLHLLVNFRCHFFPSNFVIERNAFISCSILHQLQHFGCDRSSQTIQQDLEYSWFRSESFGRKVGAWPISSSCKLKVTPPQTSYHSTKLMFWVNIF